MGKGLVSQNISNYFLKQSLMRQNIIQLFKTNQAARAVTSEGHYQGLSEQVQII